MKLMYPKWTKNVKKKKKKKKQGEERKEMT
jgi:hypothetical protein